MGGGSGDGRGGVGVVKRQNMRLKGGEGCGWGKFWREVVGDGG